VVLSLLANQAVSLGGQVTQLLPRMENFLGVSTAIVVGSISLGVAERHPVVLVVLPFFLIILYVYLVQSNTEMLSRAGHMKFLEEQVNAIVSRRVLLQESDVSPTLHGRIRFGRLSIVLIQSLMLVLLLGTVALAIANLWSLESLAWHLLFWAALFAGLLTLASATWELSRAYSRAYDAARKGFGGSPPPASSLLPHRDSPGGDGRGSASAPL